MTGMLKPSCFVIDSSDKMRVVVAKEELDMLLDHPGNSFYTTLVVGINTSFHDSFFCSVNMIYPSECCAVLRPSNTR